LGPAQSSRVRDSWDVEQHVRRTPERRMQDHCIVKRSIGQHAISPDPKLMES
jgi:hypothetical protein